MKSLFLNHFLISKSDRGNVLDLKAEVQGADIYQTLKCLVVLADTSHCSRLSMELPKCHLPLTG